MICFIVLWKTMKILFFLNFLLLITFFRSNSLFSIFKKIRQSGYYIILISIAQRLKLIWIINTKFLRIKYPKNYSHLFLNPVFLNNEDVFLTICSNSAKICYLILKMLLKTIAIHNSKEKKRYLFPSTVDPYGRILKRKYRSRVKYRLASKDILLFWIDHANFRK